jgi:ABC-type branched-subunit amino acid transport system permease subunit
MSDRPLGITALALFFGFGSLAAGASALSLAFPGSPLEAMWRLNPAARTDLGRLGPWAVVLMLAVSAACAAAAVGLWTGRPSGRRLAIALLVVNLTGDLLNSLVRGDLRALIGLPIGGAMLWYLLRRPVGAETSP